MQYGLGEHLQLSGEGITFGKLLYHSGETFFTLGYGDIVPTNGVARALAVFEAGMGFAFLGVVVGYLPVIYNSFASREIEISLLDARAGSPPTATEFLGRLGCCPDQTVLDNIFRDWERWCADLLSSQISYPVLSYFRSQHGNQSWLAALTVMLDVTSLVMTGVDGIHADQAKLTFAMARHAAVDLAQVIYSQYSATDPNRLSAEDRKRVKTELAFRGVTINDNPDAEDKLAQLREVYEPYLHGLSRPGSTMAGRKTTGRAARGIEPSRPRRSNIPATRLTITSDDHFQGPLRKAASDDYLSGSRPSKEMT